MGSRQSKINEMLAFYLRGLDKLIISMADRAQEEGILPKPKRIDTNIFIDYYNDLMDIKYYIDMSFRYEGKEIRYRISTNNSLYYKIELFNPQNRQEYIKLSNLFQNISFAERMICMSLGAYNTLYPRALEEKDKIPKHIIVYITTYLNGLERKYLERTYEDKVFMDGVADNIAKSVKYNIGKSSIEIATLNIS
jgi:hypothetical protein